MDGFSDDAQYVEMDIAYTNTDNESRFTDPGYIVIENIGKKLVFDARAPLVGDGFWNDQQLNPLLTNSGKVFFKIPMNITGIVQWVPGQNSKDVVFTVGRVN